MTAKQYLSQAIRIRLLIRQTKEHMKELEELAGSPPPIRYDREILQSSGSGDQMIRTLIQLEAEERRCKRLLEGYIEKYIEITENIRKVMPGLYSDVLYMRYIEGKNLEKIAKELNYSYEWIRHIHGRALQAFRKKFPELCKDDTQKHK